MFFTVSVLPENGEEGDIRFAVLIGMAVACLILTVASAARIGKEKRGKGCGSRRVSTALYLATGIAMLITLLCCVGYLQSSSQPQQTISPSAQPSTAQPTIYHGAQNTIAPLLLRGDQRLYHFEL